MSVESVRKDFEAERFRFESHVIERSFQKGISIDQMIDVVLTGTVTKSEKDEESQGKFMKHTFKKGGTIVVVKDCDPPFVITTNRS